MRVGLVGPNGSGKTTLLRLLNGENKPEQGSIKTAENLKIVYFDQNRELDPEVTLRRAPAPGPRAGYFSGGGVHIRCSAVRGFCSVGGRREQRGRACGR